MIKSTEYQIRTHHVTVATSPPPIFSFFMKLSCRTEPSKLLNECFWYHHFNSLQADTCTYSITVFTVDCGERHTVGYPFTDRRNICFPCTRGSANSPHTGTAVCAENPQSHIWINFQGLKVAAEVEMTSIYFQRRGYFPMSDRYRPSTQCPPRSCWLPQLLQKH